MRSLRIEFILNDKPYRLHFIAITLIIQLDSNRSASFPRRRKYLLRRRKYLSTEKTAAMASNESFPDFREHCVYGTVIFKSRVILLFFVSAKDVKFFFSSLSYIFRLGALLRYHFLNTDLMSVVKSYLLRDRVRRSLRKHVFFKIFILPNVLCLKLSYF